MGIFNRFKKEPAPAAPVIVAEPPAAEPSRIPDIDVTKKVQIADMDQGRGGKMIPETIRAQDGPLGIELPYRVATGGYRAQMKNLRSGVELELTLQVRKPEGVYPQIEVFHDGNCLGIIEVTRGELFAPAIRLAEKYGVKMAIGGVTGTYFDRVAPFVFLPEPQKLYDTLKAGIEASQ